ncbi:putative Extracellular membrane protein CFEM domain-containing protein [Seiridium cardinale]|uniref:Extracellular membrane protein CFEM domain-containing protein n=1 Tax=Seiridium cardinale TaxID=138064 RepID=A0ABR2XK79_9PEZI
MRTLPPPLQALLLVLLTPSPPTAYAIENDFSAYPSGSQACLTSSADSSGCTGDTGTEMNECLCKNGGNFIYSTASCVAKDSPSDLETVYATLQNNCEGTGVTISVSEAAFLAQASAATSTTTPTATNTGTTSSTGTATTTTSSTSSPTSTATSQGLSTGVKVGIGAGIAIGSIGLALAGVFIWLYSRRRRPVPKGGYTQTGSPAGEYNSTFGQPSPHPDSAIPLSATSGWTSPATAGMFYKPQDIQQTSGAGQPLLAELGTDSAQQVAPAELYTPHPSESLTPGTQQYGHGGFHAELPADSDPARYQSPPGSHSPYSPPYERSHF